MKETENMCGHCEEKEGCVFYAYKKLGSPDQIERRLVQLATYKKVYGEAVVTGEEE